MVCNSASKYAAFIVSKKYLLFVKIICFFILMQK